MNRCLRDKALLLLLDGEGTVLQRTHLSECEGCASRYQQLANDLGVLTQVLRGEPPANIVSDRFHPLTFHWFPAGAALAMALLLVWIGMRLWSPSAWLPLTGASNGESWSMLDDLPSNPFLLNEALAFELATEGAGSYDVAATVLEAERPCEWYDLRVLARAGSAIEGLDFSEGSRPVTCIEINQDDEKHLPKRKLSKTIS